jgi:Ni,Fe-hydrogenase I small subunit
MSSSDPIELDPKVPGAGKADEAQAVAPADAIVAAGTTEATSAIAHALASGQIDAVAAQQLLIDQIVAELPGDPAELEQVRQKITELLADDPTLARLLAP